MNGIKNETKEESIKNPLNQIFRCYKMQNIEN